MSEEGLGERVGEAIGSAINDVVGQHENGFVTRWIALIESVAPDGSRGLWTLTSDDLKAWDTVGMLGHAMHLQQGRTIAGQVQEGS